jgi:hypothetical protein
MLLDPHSQYESGVTTLVQSTHIYCRTKFYLEARRQGGEGSRSVLVSVVDLSRTSGSTEQQHPAHVLV